MTDFGKAGEVVWEDGLFGWGCDVLFGKMVCLDGDVMYCLGRWFVWMGM